MPVGRRLRSEPCRASTTVSPARWPRGRRHDRSDRRPSLRRRASGRGTSRPPRRRRVLERASSSPSPHRSREGEFEVRFTDDDAEFEQHRGDREVVHDGRPGREPETFARRTQCRSTRGWTSGTSRGTACSSSIPVTAGAVISTGPRSVDSRTIAFARRPGVRRASRAPGAPASSVRWRRRVDGRPRTAACSSLSTGGNSHR